MQDTYIAPTEQTIPASALVHNRNAFIPFSFGPANCVGKNLAMMELRGVTCAFMHRFDLTQAKGFDLDTWEPSLLDYGVTTRGQLWVQLKLRY